MDRIHCNIYRSKSISDTYREENLMETMIGNVTHVYPKWE